jgi:hypothetical protein
MRPGVPPSPFFTPGAFVDDGTGAMTDDAHRGRHTA